MSSAPKKTELRAPRRVVNRDIVFEIKDLTHLVWSERATTSGTGGTFLKAREGLSRERRYYKLSCYDSYRGIYGHECVNELVASRLADAIGLSHVAYRLVHAKVLVDGVERITWLSESADFRAEDERKIAFDLFYDLRKNPGESPLEFCSRLGWKPMIDRMIAFDFLIANRDRHGANIEVLRAQDGTVRLAPLFDNGLSLVFSCYEDEKRAASVDPMADVNANNYIGTRSLEENLKFIDTPLGFRPLSEGTVEAVFEDLDLVLPAAHRETMFKMIWERWRKLAELGMVEI